MSTRFIDPPYLTPAIFAIWTAPLFPWAASTPLPLRYLDFMHTFVNYVFCGSGVPDSHLAMPAMLLCTSGKTTECADITHDPLRAPMLAENTGVMSGPRD
jgi:hypothetical protein